MLASIVHDAGVLRNPFANAAAALISASLAQRAVDMETLVVRERQIREEEDAMFINDEVYASGFTYNFKWY